MKQYEAPEIEVDLFEVDDVLSVSEPPTPSRGGDHFYTPEDIFPEDEI